MEVIEPSTILKNYNKVIDEVQDGEPVVLTRDGVAKVVLVHIDEWQRKQAEMQLLIELNRFEREFGNGEDIAEFAKEYNLGEYSE